MKFTNCLNRSIWITMLLCFCSISVFSQKNVVKNLVDFDRKLLRFGFTVGTNVSDMSIKFSDNFLSNPLISRLEIGQTVGFQLGPIVNYRLGEHFDLRALINISFTERNYLYTYFNEQEPFGNTEHTMKIESIYGEFPLLIKYRAKRIYNYRPYLISGFNQKFDFAAKRKINEEDKPKIMLKPYDYYLEAGAGVDVYFEYFKFSVELKYAHGLRNLTVYDQTPYTDIINKMNASMVMISFHFE